MKPVAATSHSNIKQSKTLRNILNHLYSAVNTVEVWELHHQHWHLQSTSCHAFLSVTCKPQPFHLLLRFKCCSGEQTLFPDRSICSHDFVKPSQYHPHEESADLTHSWAKLRLNFTTNSINYPTLLLGGEQISLSLHLHCWHEWCNFLDVQSQYFTKM